MDPHEVIVLSRRENGTGTERTGCDGEYSGQQHGSREIMRQVQFRERVSIDLCTTHRLYVWGNGKYPEPVSTTRYTR